jgi:putative transposase
MALFEDVITTAERSRAMGSVLRRVRKRKQCLGEVEVVARQEYAGLELDAKVELIRGLIPLGLMHVHQLLDDEVVALAGPRYARNDGVVAMRHGSNPGTVRLAGQRIAVRVPRVRGEQGEIPLRSYQALHGSGELNDRLLRRVLYGISCRNYAAAAEAIPGALGLSSSSVSRAFIEASAEKLKALQERDLSGETYVALFLDGKTFADATLVIAMGVTARGDKRFLGFVETNTENEKVLTPFLRSLIERGLDVSQGLLVVIDGGKGLRAAVNQVLKTRAVVQRCVWHKRENVISYLPKSDQAQWRRRLQRAYDRPTYTEAKAALMALYRELEHRNQSAAASLAEGMEETLTLHRLGVYELLGRSFKTTNCLESVNALVEERCAKVDAWKTSNQRHRWLATALLDVEPRLRRVKGHQHLPKLQAAVRRALNIKSDVVRAKQAA